MFYQSTDKCALALLWYIAFFTLFELSIYIGGHGL